jgi:hypothetical protein
MRLTALTMMILGAMVGTGCQAAVEAGAGDDDGASTAVSQALDGTVDFADYMLPNCNGPSVPEYFPPQVFRTVPLGGSRFAVVKNLSGSSFEDWTVDADWLRISADNSWSYQMNGDWCDTECRTNNQEPGTACNHRWNNDPAVYANTLYRDPDHTSLGAPFIKRTMSFVNGVFRFAGSMKISGQNRQGCGACATNFDSPRVSRSVTARRYASRTYATPCSSQRSFSDVIELTVDAGPGAGETAIYVRGEGYIGFGGRNEIPKVACWPDASVPTPAPVDVCGGGQIQSICSALGRACPCRPGTAQDNACYYSSADRIACGLPAGGCSGDWWGTGWNLYHQVCHL